MYINVPLFAGAISMLFSFRDVVKIVIVAPAVFPVLPLLPVRELEAAGAASQVLGLLFITALRSEDGK